MIKKMVDIISSNLINQKREEEKKCPPQAYYIMGLALASLIVQILNILMDKFVFTLNGLIIEWVAVSAAVKILFIEADDFVIFEHCQSARRRVGFG